MSKIETFPAFCHISEYGETGYRYLPQMLLMAEPLTLWSPSSMLLRRSRIPVDDLLALIGEGHIRVIGRERWLTSRAFRDKHDYQYARWTPRIDDEIKRLCETDARDRHGRPIVLVVPPEDGYTWAQAQMNRDRSVVAKWHERFERTPQVLPQGTRDAIDRNLAKRKIARSEAAIVAKTILRDGRNHGQAFAMSNSEIAVQLSRVDIKFTQLLADEAGTLSIAGPRRGEQTPLAATAGELVLQTIELLRRLDDYTDRRPDLRTFLASDARNELIRWIRTMTNDVKMHRRDDIDGRVLRQLVDELSRGTFHANVRDTWRRARTESALGLAEVVTSIVDAAIYGTSPLGVVGFGMKTFSATRGGLRRFGYIPADFTGPQWPFLYAHRKRATARRRKELVQFLAGRDDEQAST